MEDSGLGGRNKQFTLSSSSLVEDDNLILREAQSSHSTKINQITFGMEHNYVNSRHLRYCKEKSTQDMEWFMTLW